MIPRNDGTAKLNTLTMADLLERVKTDPDLAKAEEFTLPGMPDIME